MTNKSELETLDRRSLQIAKRILQKQGYLSPLVIVPAGRNAIVYSLPPNKDTWFLFVMTLLRTHSARSYFVAGEAWAVELKQPVQNLPQSENPARTEIVFAYGCHRPRSRIMLTQQFVRDADRRIRFVEPVNVWRDMNFWRVPENW